MRIIRADGTEWAPDATLSESWDHRVQVTEHPVEDGRTVSDHAQVLPTGFTARVVITETPFDNVSALGGAAHVQQARDFLESIEGQIVSVVTTRYGRLENMVLLGWPNDVSVLRDMKVTLSFRQIEIAEVGFIAIPPRRPAAVAETGATTEQELGNKVVEEVSDEESTRVRSYAATLLDAVGRP